MRSVLLAQSVGTYLYIVQGVVQCEVSLIGPVGGDISIYRAGGGGYSVRSVLLAQSVGTYLYIE